MVEMWPRLLSDIVDASIEVRPIPIWSRLIRRDNGLEFFPNDSRNARLQASLQETFGVYDLTS